MIKLTITIENKLVDIEFLPSHHRSVAVLIRTLYSMKTDRNLREMLNLLYRIEVLESEALLISKDGREIKLPLP